MATFGAKAVDPPRPINRPAADIQRERGLFAPFRAIPSREMTYVCTSAAEGIDCFNYLTILSPEIAALHFSISMSLLAPVHLES